MLPLIPLAAGRKLENATVTDDRPFKELIGSLNFISTSTKSDISYAVSYLSKFNNKHDEYHWEAAKGILKYFKGSKKCRMWYEKSDLNITSFVS